MIIISVFILICTIPLLFRLKNYLYKLQNLEEKKSEEYIFLIGCFLVLMFIGLYYKNKFFLLNSLAFIFWILYDAIQFNIEMWKKFLRWK
jgi:hypothetical protein